jgi:Arc/MetJ-type ribon-helix-helix transcriptional regulator
MIDPWMTERPDRWKQMLMRSFRISETLDEQIKTECKRRRSDFSRFVRDAILLALRNRTYHGHDRSA